jgi:leucyl aminopeptidase
MCNGPAREDNIDREFQSIGELVADPFEISTIRREDYDSIRGMSEYEDVFQCKPSLSPASRAHQIAAAFMVISSGLDQVKYSH